MKAVPECYGCLRRLVYQTVSMASQDGEVRQLAIDKGLRVVEESFSYDEMTIVVATKVHAVIKAVTGNPDPYREMKDRELALGRQVCVELGGQYQDGLLGRLSLAALGNTLDFFRSIDAIRNDIGRQVDFVIDDTDKLESRLKPGGKVLYLADNAGEVFFDMPLLAWLRQLAEVAYVVKDSSVQDDITLEDVKRAGVEVELGRVITTGTATPGIDFTLASAIFKREFEAADIILAKGMGYYESLSELPARGKVFHCLRAKCRPVADAIGVPLNSYVALLR